jgi:hypothetical protein
LPIADTDVAGFVICEWAMLQSSFELAILFANVLALQPKRQSAKVKYEI